MTDGIELTPTSYIVLGLLSMFGDATPYDLKRMVSALGRKLLDTAPTPSSTPSPRVLPVPAM